jgi:hypothetical protein
MAYRPVEGLAASPSSALATALATQPPKIINLSSNPFRALGTGVSNPPSQSCHATGAMMRQTD